MKILPEITEEDAIELAEAATGDKGNYYFSGYHNKGKQDQAMCLMKLDGEMEFVIYTHQLRFRLTRFIDDYNLLYDVILKLRDVM